jgi:hypothetical protein
LVDTYWGTPPSGIPFETLLRTMPGKPHLDDTPEGMNLGSHHYEKPLGKSP